MELKDIDPEVNTVDGLLEGKVDIYGEDERSVRKGSVADILSKTFLIWA